MIAVIADDISGAAELAGVAFRFGLEAEVQLEFDPDSKADVVAVDTDSRPLGADEAAKKVGGIAGQIATAEVERIYKKTDSVLRGNVAAEIGAILRATGLTSSLLIPANPSKGRIIRGGRYWIGDLPLDETIFADDPEYPARSSDVRELLGPGGKASIRIPDVESPSDLEEQVCRMPPDALPAGGADFFEAWLRSRIAGTTRQGTIGEATLLNRIAEGKRLFVCGSLAAWPDRRKFFVERGWPVFEMADEGDIDALLSGGDLRPVLLAIGDQDPGGKSPGELVDEFGQAVSGLIRGKGRNLGAVFLEGGATAIAVLRRLGVRRLRVVAEAGPGAPVLEAIDGKDLPLFCPKPGSYPWPASVIAGG